MMRSDTVGAVTCCRCVWNWSSGRRWEIGGDEAYSDRRTSGRQLLCPEVHRSFPHGGHCLLLTLFQFVSSLTVSHHLSLSVGA